MYSWNKTGNQIIPISLVNNLVEWKLNLRVDIGATDNINICWNIEYSKYGVCQIRVVAVSVLNKAFVHVPIGNCSIIENIKPSAVYRIYI